MKKKILALAAASVLAIGMLAGCGAKQQEAAPAEEKKEEAAAEAAVEEAVVEAAVEEVVEEAAVEAVVEEALTCKIALIHQHMTNSFQIAVTEGADAKAEELGVELVHFDAGQDASTQIGQIEQCIAEGYDAIIFEPVDPAGLVDAAKKVMDAGIYCVNFSSTIEGWDKIVNGYAGASNEEAGEVEMQQVADLIGGKGKICILTGPDGDSGGLLRYKGYTNILEKYPDIEIIAEAAADWDTVKGQEKAENWLIAFDQIDAIVCENDGMAVGAGNAAGADSGIVITGVDASEDGLEAIGDGRQTGTVSQDAGEQGGLAVQMAYDLCTGKLSGLGNSATVTNVWVDASNLEDYKAGKLK